MPKIMSLAQKLAIFEVFELLNEVKKIILSQDEKSHFKGVNTLRFYAYIQKISPLAQRAVDKIKNNPTGYRVESYYLLFGK